MSCAVCSLVDPKAPCPAEGPSAFPRDAEPFQSASKALFVAPRYSDFFLCFIHIFLRRLGVPHKLPPVSGREASAPGGRARSYSVVFLQRCLWLTNKTQGVYRVLLPGPSSLMMATSHSEPRAAWLKRCACSRDGQVWNEQGLCGSGGWGAALPPLSLVPLLLLCQGDTHTRGQAASGTGLGASSLAIATQQGWGDCPRRELGLSTKAQGPLAVMSSPG